MPKKIFLTFDDGPGPKTVEIAELLNRLGIKATFFMVGKNIESMPGTVEQVAKLGHEIGVHAYEHKPLKGASLREAVREIRKTAYSIAALTGRPPKVFRAAYGRLSPASLEILKRTKLKHVDWSYDALDWKRAAEGKGLDSAGIVKRAKAGDVILFHDGAVGHYAGDAGKRGMNLLRAMPEIAAGMRQKGFEFEPIERQFQKGQRLRYRLRTLLKIGRAKAEGHAEKKMAWFRRRKA